MCMFILAKDIITFTYQTSYQNIFLFALYIFFSKLIIFDTQTVERDLKKTLEDIVNVNFYIVLGILFTNILILGIFTSNPNLSGIISLSIQLFLILIIISFFHYIFFKKKNLLIEYLYMFFIYLLYSFQYLYGNNLFFINLYKYYFQANNLWKVIIHYIFWLLIPIAIIYLQYRHGSRKKRLYVRT